MSFTITDEDMAMSDEDWSSDQRKINQAILRKYAGRLEDISERLKSSQAKLLMGKLLRAQLEWCEFLGLSISDIAEISDNTEENIRDLMATLEDEDKA